MKVFNTDIIETVTDEKKLNWCLLQGWCFKKSLSTVPKSEKYVIEQYHSGRSRRLVSYTKLNICPPSQICLRNRSYDIQSDSQRGTNNQLT